MTKITDTEQVILTAACRNNGTVPTRERSKSKADPRAYGAAVASLIKKGIIEPRGPAREGDYARDGQKLAMVAAEPTAKTPTNSEPKEHKTREGTKQALMIDLLRRPRGATLAEIVEATGWQSHTVPEPPNRSKTMSRLLELLRIARSINSTGFMVGWRSFTLGLSTNHTSPWSRAPHQKWSAPCFQP